MCVASLAFLFAQPAKADESEYLRIGPALKGAWLNESMPGQGFLVEVFTDPQVLFIAWFTFPRDSEAPTMDPVGHRWYTIQGEYSGTEADTLLYQTTGGAFLGPVPISTDRIGLATVHFTSCNTAELDYDFDDSAETGTVSLRRTVPIDEAACDSLLQNPPVPERIEASQATVFMDINLLEMPSAEIRTAQMVIVKNGVITRVSEHNPDLIPPGAAIIDGRDRYLMPGMVDTHTHLPTKVREYLGQGANLETVEESGRNQLVLYLARGVTTILNNGDFGEPLPRWGEEVEAGGLVGPSIYACLLYTSDAADEGVEV